MGASVRHCPAPRMSPGEVQPQSPRTQAPKTPLLPGNTQGVFQFKTMTCSQPSPFLSQPVLTQWQLPCSCVNSRDETQETPKAHVGAGSPNSVAHSQTLGKPGSELHRFSSSSPKLEGKT